MIIEGDCTMTSGKNYVSDNDISTCLKDMAKDRGDRRLLRNLILIVDMMKNDEKSQKHEKENHKRSIKCKKRKISFTDKG